MSIYLYCMSYDATFLNFLKSLSEFAFADIFDMSTSSLVKEKTLQFVQSKELRYSDCLKPCEQSSLDNLIKILEYDAKLMQGRLCRSNGFHA